MRRTLIVVALSLTALLGLTVAPAHAESANVKVSYGGHWCAQVGGNTVSAVQVSISNGGTVAFQTGDTASTWAVLRVPQWINSVLRCQRVEYFWWGKKVTNIPTHVYAFHPDKYPRYFQFPGHRIWM